MTDLAGLVTPLEGNPAGPDLAYDDGRVAIEEAFATSAEGQRADDVNWPQTIERIRAQAVVTRDLWLAIYLARAGANSGKLDVVVDGTTLLAVLVEELWDTVHPQLDEVGFLGRKSACDNLAHNAEFVQPLKRVVLIAHSRLGSYSAADLERFEQQGDAAEGYGMFRAAIEQIEAEEIDATIVRLDRIRDALRRTDAVLMAHAGSDTGTDFTLTYQALANIRTSLARYSQTASAEKADAGEDAAERGTLAETADQGGASGFKGGRIETRDDVVRAIDAVADYYRRREPGSAVPVALRRARDWVPMTFMQVLEDIAPASLDDARRVLMSQAMIEEAGRD